eukprot:1714125-Rhodomonas_salina.1
MHQRLRTNAYAHPPMHTPLQTRRCMLNAHPTHTPMHTHADAHTHMHTPMHTDLPSERPPQSRKDNEHSSAIRTM